ncbi:prenyltransferase/squalene oxidase repeat-containing protein [Planctomicrobium sp. SH668]|uniref:prenyltransferase/squalene oxidase repeat-containing protein n=1 Tax=Planctomicrobium sp. SH668 TaxID=3448126 RepID=UPI003F5CB2DD
MFAAVNLNAEYWHLVRLIIALLQPVLVLAFIAGLVVATAHLLSMIGTRWGDRRTSSKAMFFSVVIHLLLVVGLITLIPEYRTKFVSQLSEFDSRPIRITQNQTDSGSESLSEKRLLAESLQRFHVNSLAPLNEWERSETPREKAASNGELTRPFDATVPQTPDVPDRDWKAEIPQPEAPPNIPQVNTQLSQAQDVLSPESLTRETQTAPETPAASMERINLTTSQPQPNADLARPESPVAMPENQELISNRVPPMVKEPASEPLPNRTDLDVSPTLDGEMPAASNPVAVSVVRESPAASQDQAFPTMTRTETRTSVPSAMSPVIDRTAPRPQELPADSAMEGFDSRLSSLTPGLNGAQELPPLNTSNDPFLQRSNSDRVPMAYKLRTEDGRQKALEMFGGSKESEEAVDRSLRWMASVQNPAGYWSASEEIGASGAGVPDVGVTSLAILAFLGKLNTVDQGPYSPQVTKALRWLVQQQTAKHWGEGWGSTDGYLGGNATDFESMYCHAMATFALGEAFAMSRENPEAQWLRKPLEKAVAFIIDVQNVDGGWRYVKGQREGDMSIFGWQLMALKSAEAAGIFIDPVRKSRMQKFLTERQLGNAGGLAGYRAREAANAAQTAEALYCRQILGLGKNSKANQEALNLMLENLPQETTLNFYYWYYGTLAMHHEGGEAWERWNAALRDLLVSEQRVDGSFAGSWDPREVWGSYGGRMYSTAIATLSLEVYYRYLPHYRSYDQLSEETR